MCSHLKSFNTLFTVSSNITDFLVHSFFYEQKTEEMKVNTIQLLMVDLLARASMKNIASCDK